MATETDGVVTEPVAEGLDADATQFTGDELSWDNMLDESADQELAADAVSEEAQETAGQELDQEQSKETAPVGGVQPAQPKQETRPQQPPAQAASGTPAQQQRLHEVINGNFGELAKQLAETSFALPKDQAELFEDPRVGQFVAQRDASLFLRTMASVSQIMSEAMPTMVMQYVNAAQSARTMEGGFFGKYKDLADPKYRDGLRELLPMVQRANPGAKEEVVLAKLASTARAYFGITAPKAAETAPAANGQAGKVTARRAFTPAAKVATGGGQAGKGEKETDPLQALNNFLRAGIE